MNKNVNDKLAQLSKENRIKNAMNIRAGNQKDNIYQIHYDKQIRIPQKRERRNMNEMNSMINFIPVKRVDDSDSFISG
jgi:uncharacterized protein YaiL (DUF2058 family)